MTRVESSVPNVEKGSELPAFSGKMLEERLAETRDFGLKADIWARLIMVGVIAVIFVGLNAAVMYLIYLVFLSDVEVVRVSPAVTRVVTTQLLMSLVGATVVQVGTATAAIIWYLFPRTQQQLNQ